MTMEASSKDENENEKSLEKDTAQRRSSASAAAGSESGSETTAQQRPSALKKRKRSASDATDSASTLQERWGEMFERLKAYKEETGNCNVPNRYAKDPQLGFWVSTQRRQYRVLTSGGSTSSALTVQRAQKLVNLGFEWSAKDPRMVPWETRYGQLQDFAAKYGHAQIPIGWEENIPLSNWVSKQRQEYKLLQKGKPSRLSRERIGSLDAIGFVWEAKRGAPRQIMMPPGPTSSLASSPPGMDNASDEAKQQASRESPSRHAAAKASSPPSSHKSSKGMGPVSPPNSAPATPYARELPVVARLPPGVSSPYGLPVARLPPPPAGSASSPYSSDPGYPPGARYQHDAYYPPAQSMYPPSMHPSYAPPLATPWSRDNRGHSSPPYPVSSQGPPPPWQMPPRMGRILTPLYPMQPPPGARYTLPAAPHSDPRNYESRPGPPPPIYGGGRPGGAGAGGYYAQYPEQHMPRGEPQQQQVPFSRHPDDGRGRPGEQHHYTSPPPDERNRRQV